MCSHSFVIGTVVSNESYTFSATDRSKVTAGKKPEKAAEFPVFLSLDERLQGSEPEKFEVPVVANQTLAEFEDNVLRLHAINLSNYALVLMGRDVKDDHAFLSDLGFVPECTIHAGCYFPFFHLDTG